MNQKLIGISIGDPSGIGPEVSIKSILYCQKKSQKTKYLLAGSASIAKAIIKRNNLNATIKIVTDVASLPRITEPTEINLIEVNGMEEGDYQFGIINKKCAMFAAETVLLLSKFALEKKISAVACAPINKQSFLLAKGYIPGHTEFIADITGTKNFGMFFTSNKISGIPVTGHIPLGKVDSSITIDSILQKIGLGHDAFKKFYNKNPRIVVCGLDPHCGEGGLLGKLDKEIVNVAVIKAKKLGYNIEGCISADAVFRPYIINRYDLIISMYHDQLKVGFAALNGDKFVSVLVGIPFLRATTTIGSAFDIAGKGIANPENMIRCIQFVEKHAS